MISLQKDSRLKGNRKICQEQGLKNNYVIMEIVS